VHQKCFIFLEAEISDNFSEDAPKPDWNSITYLSVLPG
jgi:hypothetical protein